MSETKYIEFRGDAVPDWVPRDPWPKELERDNGADAWVESVHANTRGEFLSPHYLYRLPASMKPAEEKTPQPGEWWELENGEVVYCVGRDPAGSVWWQSKSDNKDGEVYCYYTPVRHLPDCTGFDYEIPPEEPEPETITVYRWLLRRNPTTYITSDCYFTDKYTPANGVKIIDSIEFEVTGD